MANRAPYARAVVAVTSGKGGVGKSTVAVNLAVGAAQRGLRVGLLDGDVYGPSVPRLLSLHGEQLAWGEGDESHRMIPAENFGVRVVSTALTTPELDTPLAWRSAVATSAIVQLLDDVAWGPLDLLVVDMPPGTGDVQLTIAEEVPLALAVVVTTPQLVATDDVARALRMLAELAVPAALVENMSWFRAPDTGQIHHPFGAGGGQRLAERYGVPLLAELPLTPVVGVEADEGRPIVAVGDEAARAPWRALVDAVLAQPALRARLDHSIARGEMR
jgi:ATP-binding protein involved in chromosome partitioning